ncbi:MAG: hypothetical protein P8M12_01085 [Flavobacteriales bacterium]|nr:hypothetical protein [Flavobacteriales bacterium]
MKKLNNILFFIAIGVLFIPLVFQYSATNETLQPLNGVFEKTDTLQFSIPSWKNKKWQENRELLIKNNLKIKPLIVRIGHELDYRLFKEYHMADLLIGKDGYLFSKSWSNAKCCANNLNKDSLDIFIKKLATLATLLEKKGKYFKVIIPPSKEELYANKLPLLYTLDNENSDYTLLKKSLANNKIAYWDLLSYYKVIDDTARFPIYSKTSAHWTTYGAHFTLLKLLNDMSVFFNGDMPNLAVKSFKKEKFKGGDGDHEQTLNLINRIDNKDFLYPAYKIDSSKNKTFKPKVITIGDSFYWALKSCWMLPYIYKKDSKYLYYFSTVYYNNDYTKSHSIDSLNIVEEIESCNAVVIINSTHNLNGFPYGLEKKIDELILALK